MDTMQNDNFKGATAPFFITDCNKSCAKNSTIDVSVKCGYIISITDLEKLK